MQGTDYVQRSPKFAQLVKKPTTFYWTRKFTNVITNTIPNLKNPMRQHYPVTYAKVFEVNSFLPHALIQKLIFVKYYLDKFRPLKVNMDILKKVCMK